MAYQTVDIKETTRLGRVQKTGKPRNIVVSFTSESCRNLVYKERKKLVTSTDPRRNIYINDRLTEHRQNVLYTARKLVKSHKIFAAWGHAGNILVRKTASSSIIQVDDHDSLRKIVDDQLSTNTDKECMSETLTHLSDYSFEYDSDM